MRDPAERLESELCQNIFRLLCEKGADFSGEYFSALAKPFGSTSRKVSKQLCDEVLSFFEKEVWPFAQLLHQSSYELNNTLNFDVNKIYANIASGSEKLAHSGHLVAEKLPKNTQKLMKKIFRYVLWPYIRESHFVSKGLLKPRGYPGDYIILEEMYDGNTKSMGLGYIYDTVFLNTQLCQGLRNRKDQMKQLLSNYFKSKKINETIVLDVGCGSSRALREISVPKEGEGISIYLMDFDRSAIDFSIHNLKSKMPKANLIPLNFDVTALMTRENVDQYGMQPCDLIYSIGLFDYLPDRVLLKIIENLLALLKEDGLFVFAHKDHTVYDPEIADWFCDWKYYPRAQEDFERILGDLNVDLESVSFSREKDGYIFFVHINKSKKVESKEQKV